MRGVKRKKGRKRKMDGEREGERGEGREGERGVGREVGGEREGKEREFTHLHS